MAASVPNSVWHQSTTSVGDLSVESLNKIMWQNRMQMQQYPSASLMTSVRTFMTEFVKQENEQILQTMDKKN